MDFQAPTIDYLVLMPLLWVAGAGMIIMLLDLCLLYTSPSPRD